MNQSSGSKSLSLIFGKRTKSALSALLWREKINDRLSIILLLEVLFTTTTTKTLL
jgi:hypothetical protein